MISEISQGGQCKCWGSALRLVKSIALALRRVGFDLALRQKPPVECPMFSLLTHKAHPNKGLEWRNCKMGVSVALNQSLGLGAKIDKLLC